MKIGDCMKRNIIFISSEATIREAASQMTACHIGLLPVVNRNRKLIGVIGLPDLLSLEMPAFFNLIADLDFVSDFGAAEFIRPTPEQIDLPVTTLMQPARSVSENSKMLHAYGLMLKHNLSDLPVVSENGQLVGIVSRVDIGTAILSSWDKIEASNP